ncbi:uncharacterized protein LOC118644872 [Monomorium pharaonis]|uniref:uncharacterized protein LOC118644872 n=1 Tax=Monomorium pharaonis TaxID=307658 RepID=UPI0017473A54|nr:uncharacterized protein LOC118644872 [Monomorium pharaonis]
MQWGTFVRNRIKEIRVHSKPNEWRHVPGDLNPADLPSRGCTPTQLVQSNWWLGPTWLHRLESDWPTTQGEFNEEEIKGESKKSILIHAVTAETSIFKVGSHFSSYNKLIRFLAWMHRFFANCKRENINVKHELPKRSYLSDAERKKLRLTLTEIVAAEIRLLKYLQNQMFTNKEKLSSFRLIKSENGLYVLKTKIFNRTDNHNFICPVLLDSNHEIVYMLVKEIHEAMGHAGTQIVMNHIRERFWIISLRKTIKSVIANCMTCKRQRTKRMECETPPLPPHRVRDTTVFEITGIDFAGPLILRGGGKAWICIFTCAVYRAVHFELASTLSTQGFLECLRRFIARRGRPRVIHSDNGTNFTGAANALSRLDWQRIAKHNSAVQIDWYFNPPAAPWWGGWWERLVGILKALLRKILGKASLSYESLNTILCDAEAIINTRPLTYMSEDPDDLKPLSPSMFLQENREYGVPDCDMLYRVKLDKKFKHRQKILQDLRKRFRTEYLGQLLLKNGKKKETRKIRIGDVVLIGDDTHKRIDWPLARVVDAIPSRDGQERVFVLKTKNGLFKRAVQRIYPLEIVQEESRDFSKDLCKQRGFKKTSDRANCTSSEPPACEQKDHGSQIVTTRSGRISKKPMRLEY